VGVPQKLDQEELLPTDNDGEAKEEVALVDVAEEMEEDATVAPLSDEPLTGKTCATVPGTEGNTTGILAAPTVGPRGVCPAGQALAGSTPRVRIEGDFPSLVSIFLSLILIFSSSRT